MALMRLLSLCAAASIAPTTMSPSSAWADDVSAGVVLPGLSSDPVGSVTSSAVSIVLRSGNVDLRWIVNIRGHARPAVTIDMPRFGWLGASEPYPDRHFPELHLGGDGPATLESSFIAVVGSRDVTEEIRAAAVDPFVIAETPPFVFATPESIRTLAKIGAIEKTDGEYIAKWTAQRKVRLELNASPVLNLILNYRARPGYVLRRFDQMNVPKWLAGYCLTTSELRKLLGNPSASSTFVVRNYTINTGIDGASPPQVAVLVGARSQTEDRRSLVAFCGVDGKAIIGRETDVQSPARADPSGKVQILLLGATNL